MRGSTNKLTRKLIALSLVLGLLVAGLAIAGSGSSAQGSVAADYVSGEASALDASEWEAVYAEGVVDIELGDTTVISGEGASVEGDVVRITAAGVYRVTGTLTAGSLEIDTQGKVYLEFDGVDITSDSGPALLVTDAKKVVISLKEGTTNSLADTADGSGSGATLATNDTLLINGKGTLIVAGNNNEAMSSDDDIIINSGTIRVTAVGDGMSANDDITVNGGDITVIAGSDGLDSAGTVNVNAGTLVAFGGTDRGQAGIASLGAFTVTGGTVIAGGYEVTPLGGDSKQTAIWVGSESVQPAGTDVLVSRDGEEIVSFSPEAEYQVLFVSSPDLLPGVQYEAYIGGTSGVTVVAAAR